MIEAWYNINISHSSYVWSDEKNEKLTKATDAHEKVNTSAFNFTFM